LDGWGGYSLVRLVSLFLGGGGTRQETATHQDACNGYRTVSVHVDSSWQ
jgi:hypothetical protein